MKWSEWGGVGEVELWCGLAGVGQCGVVSEWLSEMDCVSEVHWVGGWGREGGREVGVGRWWVSGWMRSIEWGALSELVVGQWVRVCVSEWVSEWVSEMDWVTEVHWVSGWVSECVSDWEREGGERERLSAWLVDWSFWLSDWGSGWVRWIEWVRCIEWVGGSVSAWGREGEREWEREGLIDWMSEWVKVVEWDGLSEWGALSGWVVGQGVSALVCEWMSGWVRLSEWVRCSGWVGQWVLEWERDEVREREWERELYR